MHNRRVLWTILMMALTALAAFAQSQSLRVTIRHAFTAGEKQFPAGQYQISRDPGLRFIRIAAADGKNAAQVPILTRIAASTHNTPKDAHLVFDKIGQTHVLSELWIPGQDGFVLNAPTGQHEHEVIDTPVP